MAKAQVVCLPSMLYVKEDAQKFLRYYLKSCYWFFAITSKNVLKIDPSLILSLLD